MQLAATCSDQQDKLVMQPRNLKYIHNIQSEMNRISKPEDDVALVEIKSIVHPKHIPDKRRFNGKLYVVQRLPEMDAHINKLLGIGIPLTFGYDTTFNCGDFYVSILVFRHPCIKKEPIIPAGFLFHEAKEAVGHRMFFENKVTQIPKMHSAMVSIVTDRESALKAAIVGSLPKCNYLFCYIHIKKVCIFI